MGTVVSISEAASIAIHSLAVIHKHSGKRINASDIAKITGFSKNHLSKILQRLVKYNYLKSNRGPTGGFVLLKNPAEIKLIEIYTIIDGVLETNHCFMYNGACPLEECEFTSISRKINNDIKNYLESKTIADLTLNIKN